MDQLASRITEKKLFENGRVFIAPTGAKDVVSIEGSVLGGANYLPPSLEQVSILAGQLLDAGTKKHSKDELREALADRGAWLSFNVSGDRTYFSGSCLPEDLSFLLKLAAECLGMSTFPERELHIIREQALGRLHESKTETETQAYREASRLIFDEKHINYVHKENVTEKHLKGVTRKQVLDFHKILGRGGLVLAIVGDTTETSALKAVEIAFSSLPKGILEYPTKSKNKKLPVAQEKYIEIPKKANIDLYLAAALPLTYDDTLYYPTVMLTNMLGGGFAAHLMQTIRERDGLTYGISAMLSDFSKDTEGSFRIWSTFSPLLFEKGLKAIRKEIEFFFKSGLTEESLAKRKDDITGSYVIGLSTTHGLASQLHSIGIRGKELSFLDTYHDVIRSITVSDLKKARDIIPLDALSLAAAGTFPKVAP